ncbi:dienelactone hydrolase endo-1,3,1,4-beta-D-glucanase [Guyanagaster necrorhizus]|uniref:Dienelactone hydrolase endo-1,3,1,4-beta-D-glucanase n=1 Tax=Guyanagaster necrorhizus TaxID=856835 RepID=A0A9P7VPX9_9AGAR|nr:dienelactone hydrolase endo-1,3,1,4-beta-D-glucanase [Guyanagaster necrorhizus MCA 3950]KAG7444447.1 dienelactone hydrolase endo-1,3,1,4-beta-D-glucanase [Guyanagaster necrorhizus MCA 3950]
MSLCKDCISGVSHEGTPTGKIEQIGRVECYIATPIGEYANNKVILFLPDAFGITLPNAQLLADDFARNGFKIVMPDYFNNDPVPADFLEPGRTFDIAKWLANHSAADTRPALDRVIAALKESGITEFGATGYCFGGRYVFDLAFEGVLKAAVVSHPSLLKFPDDFERYATAVEAPLLINSCTFDEMFPKEIHDKTDELFVKFSPGYKREYWEGCTHGFAVRGDLSNPQVKAGKEGAFKAAVQWFLSHL